MYDNECIMGIFSTVFHSVMPNSVCIVIDILTYIGLQYCEIERYLSIIIL